MNGKDCNGVENFWLFHHGVDIILLSQSDSLEHSDETS